MIGTELWDLACEYFNASPDKHQIVGADGSDRLMFKISYQNQSCLGVSFDDLQLNRRFVVYASYFERRQFPVPKVLKVAPGGGSYLISYLTGDTLADSLKQMTVDQKLVAYRSVLHWLYKFYKEGRSLMTMYPERRFNHKLYQSDWDYFLEEFARYHGLDRLITVNFEIAAEKLLLKLDTFDNHGFVYRDFQARNIIWQEGKPWFIDFQDGMLGPAGYDLASLLFSSASQLKFSEKQLLWEYYFKHTAALLAKDDTMLADEFFHMLFIRRLRSLGTYSKLGFKLGKPGFKEGLLPTIQDLLQLRQVAPSLILYQPIFEFLQRCLEKLKAQNMS